MNKATCNAYIQCQVCGRCTYAGLALHCSGSCLLFSDMMKHRDGNQVCVWASSKTAKDLWKTTSPPAPSCDCWLDTAFQFQHVPSPTHAGSHTVCTNPPPLLPLSLPLVWVKHLQWGREGGGVNTVHNSHMENIEAVVHPNRIVFY